MLGRFVFCLFFVTLSGSTGLARMEKPSSPQIRLTIEELFISSSSFSCSFRFFLSVWTEKNYYSIIHFIFALSEIILSICLFFYPDFSNSDDGIFLNAATIVEIKLFQLDPTTLCLVRFVTFFFLVISFFVFVFVSCLILPMLIFSVPQFYYLWSLGVVNLFCVGQNFFLLLPFHCFVHQWCLTIIIKKNKDEKIESE